MSIRQVNLPVPSVEVRGGPNGEYRLDFAWVEILYTVEVDGFTWHFSPEHAGRDEARRDRLRQCGWTVKVFTWRDVVREPARVQQEIADCYQRCLLARTG